MRSIEKAIEEFNKLTANTNRDFTIWDLQQIHDRANEESDLIIDSLRAGYAIGYRTCKRDMKKRLQSAATHPEA